MLRLRCSVENVDDLLRPGNSAKGVFRVGAKERIARYLVGISGRCIMERNNPTTAVLIKGHRPHFGLTDTSRALQYGLEYWLKCAGGRTDDFQYLRSRRLLLKRLGKIGCALPQFIEQPRVLDGYDRLGGEVLHKFDLLVGKGTNFLPVNQDSSHQRFVLEHWHGDEGSRAA